MTALVSSHLTAQLAPFSAHVEEFGPLGRRLLICEHASADIPAAWGDLGLPQSARQAHIAWDPGALALARSLAEALGAALVHAPVSRLVYDLNRAPNHVGAMPARSEVYDIPGNDGLDAAARWARISQVYLPFHAGLHQEIARRMAYGFSPILLTIHSFTPVYYGARREVEFGVIHDQDPRLANAIMRHAPAGMVTRLNEPYAAADGVTHMLKLQAGPYALANAMLEIRNDLIDSPQDVAVMAARLAPCLESALSELEAS